MQGFRTLAVATGAAPGCPAFDPPGACPVPRRARRQRHARRRDVDRVTRDGRRHGCYAPHDFNPGRASACHSLHSIETQLGDFK